MKTQIISQERVKEAAALIKKGGLVVFPTETVYGLGASAFNPVACARIFSAKGRPSDNPLIVHVASDEQLAEVVSEIPEDAQKLRNAFWPGPLSLILPKSPSLPDIVTAGLPTVAVRWPRNSVAQEFLLECGNGIAAPSANVSGAPSPTNFEMAKSAMLGRVDGILQGEDAEVGLESTIVGFVNGQTKIFRPGSITAEEIASVLGVDLDSLVYRPAPEGRPLSPGLKYTHYKPNAEVRLFQSIDELKPLFDTEMKVGVMLVQDGVQQHSFPENWEVLKFSDWNDFAKYLYASFHELDQVCCSLILTQLPSQQGIGAAIANRLLKAAGKTPLP